MNDKEIIIRETLDEDISGLFKILNDFLLFVIVIFLYLTALNLSKDHLISIGSSFKEDIYLTSI